MIRSHRWFSLAVIVTIALGIGVNTTVFTLVNAVLFKPLDLPGGDRLLSIRNHNLTEEHSRFGMSYPEFTAYKRDNQTFESLEAIASASIVMSEPGNPPERVNEARVSDGFLGMVKAQPVLGRNFDHDDHLPGATAVAIIGYDLWQTRYGGDASIIASQVTIDGESNTIIGVMPKGFKFPRNQAMWRPLEKNEESLDFSNRPLDLYGIRKRGVSKKMATRDLELIAQRLAEDHSDTNESIRPVPMTFHEEGNGGNIRVVFLTMLVQRGGK
ncbi:MAG: ABC transporter permease, partial [Verrucomicrobiae bacterium]|nr:ABC transporter permease [Verrucomicrobiae bacterium]